MRLTTDVIAYTVAHMPKWNPINVCSYHLQEAGATPVQEIAYAMCTAITVLDAVRDSGQVPPERMGEVVARISFFVNAGVRFVEEMCKIRAFSRLWDKITQRAVRHRRPRRPPFPLGVQVNSLGLTEAQPENNVQRIVMEMLAVTLSKDARARAVQLPAWNEALGLPRPWDQQWSLRIQQVLAYESDLLEYGDLFNGSPRRGGQDGGAGGRRRGGDRQGAGDGRGDTGGRVRLPEGPARRLARGPARTDRVRRGQDVGVNCFETTEPSPLTADLDAAVQRVDPTHELAVLADLAAWRRQRDEAEVRTALDRLKADAAQQGVNLMTATLACARVGVTTGEWASALREVFGEYRPPTGVSGAPVAAAAGPGAELAAVRAAVAATAAELGAGRLRLLVGKPGLDGHSNGAEQIAVRARDAGFEVLYQGIRLTPGQIVAAAVAEDVHCVGLSILSGGHAELVPEVLRRLRRAGAGDLPVVVGGIIPAADAGPCAPRGWPPSSPPGTSTSPPSSAASSTRYGSPTSSSRGRAGRATWPGRPSGPGMNAPRHVPRLAVT